MNKYSMARYFQKRQAFTLGSRNERSARAALRLQPLRVEELEPRLAPAANLTITNVSYYNTNVQPVTSINAGQLIYVVADFTTTNLPGNASYRIAYTVNGFTQYSGELTDGAGVSGTSSWYEYWGYFDTTPGTNQVSVTADPDQSVAGTFTYNTMNAAFTGLEPTVGYFSYSVAQLRDAYGLNSIPNFGSATPDGSGQTIALTEAGNDPSILSDLDGFDQGMALTLTSTESLYQQYGSASSFVNVYNQYGQNITADIGTSGANGVPTSDPSGGWEGEETLDVEWAHAIAPGAKIDIIETNFNATLDNGFLNDPDLDTGVQLAASLPGVSVVSNSWGIDEFSGQTALDSSTFVTPSGHTGVTFLAGSGDGGAHSYGGTPTVNDADSFYPSSSPNVVSVGATELTLDNNAYGGETGWSYGTPRTLNNGSASYTQTGSWATQSGGFSGTYSTAQGGTSSSAVWTTSLTNADYGWGSAVEVSATWTPSAANATDATYTIYDGTASSGTVIGVIPVDQTRAPNGTADGNSQFQELGDFYPTSGTITVVLNAASANGTVDADAIGIASAWASSGGPSQYESEPSYQEAVQSTGFRTTPDVSFDGAINSGVTCYQYGGWYFDYAGTSLATQCWAALIAIVNQGRVAENSTTLNSSANPQQALEAIYSLPSSDFNQVTGGYNGFNAGPGYNYVTGRGSPIANLVVPDLVSYGINLNDGVLTITPNTDSSSISLTLSDSGAVDVILDGRQQDFSPGLVNSIVVNGLGGSDSLTVNDTGTGFAQTYTVAAGSITRSGAPPIVYSNVPNVTLDAGNLGDTVNWEGDAAGTTVTIETGTGTNTVDVGNADDTLDDFQGNTVLVGQGSNNTVVVNDQGSAVAHTYGISGSSVTRDAAGFNLSYSDVQNLTFDAGSGGNRINFSGTAAGESTTVNAGSGGDLIYATDFTDPNNLFTLNDFLGTEQINGTAGNTAVDVVDGGPDFTYTLTASSVTRTGGVAIVAAPPMISLSYSGLQTLALVDGGGNTFNWQGTAAGTTTILDEVGPGDTINMGDANNTLDGFLGVPIIAGYGDLTDTLNIHDQGSTAAHNYAIANGVSIPFTYYFDIPANDQDRTPLQSYTVVGSSFTRDGLTLLYSGLDTVNFYAGSGNNNIDWQGNSGDGSGTLPSNFLSLLGLSAPPPFVATTVYTGTGKNTVTLGNGSHTLDNFGGTAVLVGQGSNNSVTFDDSGSTTPHTYALSAGALSRDGFTFDYSDVQSLTLLGGSGGNAIDWQGDAAGITDTVFTGAGTNTINFGNSANTLDSFLGTPTVQGQGTDNTVNVFDQGSTTPHTYVITGDSLTRDGGTGYGYDVQTVNYDFGSGGNVIDWQGDAAGETDTVYTGAGANTINFGNANNTLDSFLGQPILQGQGSNNTINVYDQGSTTSHSYVLTPTSFTRDGGTGYGYDIQNANFFFGAGNNTLDWQGNAAGTVYTATFPGGSDQISGDYSAAATTINGAVSLNGATAAFGTLSIGSQGSLNLSQGATGTITATSINDQASITGSGHLALSDSGNFTSGNLSLVLGGTTAGTNYDQVQVGGTATLTGSLSLSLVPGFVPTAGQTFTIVEDLASTPVSGTFTGLPNGTLIHVNGVNGSNQPFTAILEINYNGADVVLTVVAQPQVSAANATVTVAVGTTATNAGTWLQPGFSGADTITASVGTITQTGSNGSGTWSWSYPVITTLQAQTVTITANDGQGDTATTTFALVVNPDATTTTVQSSVNPSYNGESVTFTATVTPANADPVPAGGTVTFLDGSAVLGTGTLSGDVATFTTSALATGGHSITASYGGDANYGGSSSGTLTQTVKAYASTTSVTSSVNPSVFGQKVTFTATVKAASGSVVPTGTVTFLDGTTTLGTGTLNSSGKATFSTTALAVGVQAITVSYGGDSNFTGSTSSTLTQTVNQASSTAKVSSSANPAVFGQSVTFTATISAASPGSGTPTGTVTFLDGSTTLGTGTLSGGKATFLTNALAVGSHSITVSYGGDGNFTGSTSPVLSQTVNPDATVGKVMSSANPSVYGQSVTFTATVTAKTPGSGTPAGTVTFYNGSTALAMVPLTAGSATYTTSTLAVGNHSITFQFAPSNGNFTASTSATFTQVVHQSYTSTTLASSLNPSTFGTSVTFTAVVTATAPGSGIPTGSVTFKDGSKTLMVVSLDPTGTATYTTSTLAVGNHTISATYGGSTSYRSANPASLTQVVNAAGNNHVVASVLTAELTSQQLAAKSFGLANTSQTTTLGTISGNSASSSFFASATGYQQGLASESIAASQGSQNSGNRVSALDQFFASFGNDGSDLTDPEDKS